MTEKELFWTPLDNAAKIFPAIRNKEQTTVIRITAKLTKCIRISSLFRAVERAEKRFPYFKVGLRRGFFWYYLEAIADPIPIYHDTDAPCRSFGRKSETNLLMRILVHKDKLSVEFSHILTDGFGLLTFLKAVLIYYYQDIGIIQPDDVDSFYTMMPDKEEFEDAYARYFKQSVPKLIKQPKAYHIPFLLSKPVRFEVLVALLSVNELQQISREKGVSITNFLVAVYLLTLQDVYLEAKAKGFRSSSKIARVQVPVNIRKIYPTKSLRNFSLFVMPEIDFRLGQYTFDEIVKIVHHRMQLETDEKLISKIMARNVSSERNLLVRGIPIWLKNLLLYSAYYSKGANLYSGVLSNLGKIQLPDALRNKIDYLAISPPPPNKRLKINCGVIGFEDKLTLSFGNMTDSKVFERKFLRFLSQQGVRIRII